MDRVNASCRRVIRLVGLGEKENADVYATSKALDSWLGPDGLEGGSIGSKEILSVEATASETIGKTDEFQDSEPEGYNRSVEMSSVHIL